MTSKIQQILHRYKDKLHGQDKSQMNYYQSLGSLLLSTINLRINKDNMKINPNMFDQEGQIQILKMLSEKKNQLPEIIKITLGHYFDKLFAQGSYKNILSEIQSLVVLNNRVIQQPNSISSLSFDSQLTQSQSYYLDIFGHNLKLDHSFVISKQQQVQKWVDYCTRLKSYLASIVNPKSYIDIFYKLYGGQYELDSKQDKIIAKIQLNYLSNEPEIYQHQMTFKKNKKDDKKNCERLTILILLYKIFATHPQLFKLFCFEIKRKSYQIVLKHNPQMQRIIKEYFNFYIDRPTAIIQLNKFKDQLIDKKKKEHCFFEDFNEIKQHFSKIPQIKEKFKVFDFRIIQQPQTNEGFLIKIKFQYTYNCEHKVFQEGQIKQFPQKPLYWKKKKQAERFVKEETVQYIYKNYDITIIKMHLEERKRKKKVQSIEK